MRAAFLLLLLFVLNSRANAKTYYFSSSIGKDNRTSVQAQNPLTPWRSIEKLNSFFALLQPGDSVLFKRGDTFYGTFVISKSGNAFAPIVLSAYGSGAKPVLSGFTPVTTWVAKGGGIYESAAVLPATAMNLVVINNEVQERGRYPNLSAPNKGFLYLEAHNSRSSITDNELAASPNWTGAELVLRSWKGVYDRAKITAHSGGTLSAPLNFEPHNGHGYFIQDDIRTLDRNGEWFFNKTTRKLNVFFGTTAPSAYKVQASTIDTLIYATDKSYITLSGLSLQGANQAAVYLRYCKNIRITACDFLYSGEDALHLKGASNLNITNNTFNHSLTNAIGASIGGDYWTITDNVIKNTTLSAGLAQSGNADGYAIYSKGDHHTIERNTIDSMGNCAIRFSGDNILIKNNVISYFTLTRCDGGAIYSIFGKSVNRRIIGNIIRHGLGEGVGVGKPDGMSSSGIYFDSEVTGVEVQANTVTNCSKTGIFILNSAGIDLKNNTCFDNATQLVLSHVGNGTALSNLNVKNNILFSKAAWQGIFYAGAQSDYIKQIGSLDSNYYCRPADEDRAISTLYVNSLGQKVYGVWDLQGWHQAFVHDKNSKKTARQLPSYVVNALVGGNKALSSSVQASVSPTSNYYQTDVPVGGVSSSKRYLLRFSVQSTKDTMVRVFLRQRGGSFTRLSEDRHFKISPSKRDYEFMFDKPVSAADAALLFTTSAKDLQFQLSNIQFHEADLSLQNPEDRIRFEYNPTSTSKTVPLDATYVDVKNKRYKGSVTIQPYSSIILLRDTESPADTNKDTASILFTQLSRSVKVEQGEKINLAEYITTSNETPVNIKLNAKDDNGKVPKWLRVNKKLLESHSYTTESEIDFNINASDLAVGKYSALITASAPNYKSAVLSIELSVVKAASVTKTNLNVNFQDSATQVPDGWVADFGQPYGKRTSANQGSGNTYGWINPKDNTPLDLTVNGRNRRSPNDALQATLMHMQARKVVEGIWEAKVANGTYDVTVSVGDDAYLDSRHTINIEGVPAVKSFIPTSNQRFRKVTVSVNVTDGRLTVDAIGGSNSKLNYISIRSSTNTATASARTEAANSSSEQQTSATSAMPKEQILPEDNQKATLSISKLFPNPSTAHFNVSVQGSSNQPVSLYIYDYSGRLRESKNSIAVNSTIQVGNQLPRGMYLLQIVQGTKKAETKLTKL